MSKIVGKIYSAVDANELEQERKNKSNVFAELNDETAHSNELLLVKVSDLQRKVTELELQIEKQNEKLAEAKKIIKRFIENETYKPVSIRWEKFLLSAMDFIKE